MTSATNAEIAEFYSRQSERFGASGVLPHHEARAERLRRHIGPPPGRILELGGGAGGTAVATARLGYEVHSIELSPVRVRLARELAAGERENRLTLVEGDFYTTPLGEEYDAVAYWNGFGMGSDEDQRRLLRRIALEWLKPGGTLLVDVFNPTWWARLSGEPKEHEEYGAVQRTTFDAESSRFVDRWWPIEREDEAIEQRIRCYSPPDLTLLVEGTGLRIGKFETNDRPGLGDLADQYAYLVVLQPM